MSAAGTAAGSSSRRRRRRSISLDVKLEVLRRYERGERAADIRRALGLTGSTVSTIRANAERIRASCRSVDPASAARTSRTRAAAMETMERLLRAWIEGERRRGAALGLLAVQDKARGLYEELRAREGVGSDGKAFAASHGWFERFKRRSSLGSIGAAAAGTADAAASAARFAERFAETVAAGGYSPKQVLNVDETSLLWRRAGASGASAAAAPPPKDRCTLLLGGNAAGDLKLRPLVVYHSETPRALRGCPKGELPVVWRSDARGWITGAIFLEWFSGPLHAELREYCAREGLPFRALLVVDGAAAHPAGVASLSEDVRVVFLPPDAASLVQPMRRGAIAAFKERYLRRAVPAAGTGAAAAGGGTAAAGGGGEGCPPVVASTAATADEEEPPAPAWRSFSVRDAVDAIAEAWAGVPPACMNAAWRPLWPACVRDAPEPDDEGGGGDDDDEEEDGGEQEDEEDDEEEVEEEALLRLDDRLPAEDGEREAAPTARRLSRALAHVRRAAAIFGEGDADCRRSARVARLLNGAVGCYRNIYGRRMRRAKRLWLEAAAAGGRGGGRAGGGAAEASVSPEGQTCGPAVPLSSSSTGAVS